MSAQDVIAKARGINPRRWILAAALLVFILLGYRALRPAKIENSNSYFTVKRGDFLISVVEGGTLQAVNEVAIRNEVEGTSRIIYIVPEGSYVKRGDLLVELDSASAQDQVNTQLISVEKAQFALVQAEEQLAIQKSVVDSEIRAAELKLQFAKMDLEKFEKGEERQERRKAEADIASIREKLEIDREKAKWSVELAEKGFETKANRDRDNLTLLQTTISLEMATNLLSMLEIFDLPKKRATFESAVREASEELQRVKHQGTSKVAQFEADVRTQKITLELSRNKLERDQRNLAAARIIAPQDGLVVYSVSDNRFSSESLIEEGATVRNRQTFIKLPDISEMKLLVKIHESHINMITQGQPAYIVLDSMPDQRFRGYVSKVGLLPDTQSRWGNPNLKVYATEILVTDNLPDVKPGVSARAEIIVTNLQNVISVPLQAVATQQGQPVVYLADGTGSKPVKVQVGLYNTKFIEITSGLKEGDRVLLAPPLDTRQKDLGGAIMDENEEAPATNNFPIPPVRILPPELNGSEEPSGERPGRTNNMTGGQRPNFEELRKQFDTNGDGELDEQERQTMRERMGGFGQRGGRPRGNSGEGQPESGGGERRTRRPPGDTPQDGDRQTQRTRGDRTPATALSE
jgi:HlyD family secretion protein